MDRGPGGLALSAARPGALAIIWAISARGPTAEFDVNGSAGRFAGSVGTITIGRDPVIWAVSARRRNRDRPIRRAV
jgi:hypothetical protein